MKPQIQEAIKLSSYFLITERTTGLLDERKASEVVNDQQLLSGKIVNRQTGSRVIRLWSFNLLCDMIKSCLKLPPTNADKTFDVVNTENVSFELETSLIYNFYFTSVV